MHINDFHNCSNLLDFHAFADDTNLFLEDCSLLHLENTINREIEKVYVCLCANNLNTDKTHFALFHSPQKIINYNFRITIKNTIIKQELY